MYRDMISGYLIGVLTTALAFIFALAVTSSASSDLRREAIDRGYALYCPMTGEWSWRGECADAAE